MKITKFVHSCLLVEMPAPVNRTVLFDPGMMSEAALDVDSLQFLDDIVITHSHGDHFSVTLLKALVGRFPAVRITATNEIVALLAREGITAYAQPADGMSFFDSPHERIRPTIDADPPEQIGVHYLDMLTHPGDSHHFTETKPILALPVQAPWGSEVQAVELGLKLQPKHILPIHDWHWSDEARQGEYERLYQAFANQDITFHKLVTGESITIDGSR